MAISWSRYSTACDEDKPPPSRLVHFTAILAKTRYLNAADRAAAQARLTRGLGADAGCVFVLIVIPS
jgi:hypothetical protein